MLPRPIILFLFVFTTLMTITSGVEDSTTVETRQGLLEGLTLKSRNGKPYYAFKGIPYAKYPGRFEVATEHATWDGVRPAKELGSICAQVDLFDPIPEPKGAEDCLFMQIYTPTLDKEAKLPVLFFIHGGGFMSWTGNDFDGKYFVDEDVIFVSINYRLGPMGFLTFGDDEIAGNIGLKDQLLALKWVTSNIAAFGGDPTKVTISGFSAGAASSHMHVLSPQTKGLFRGAISHSGTALGFWAIQKNPWENGVKLASFVGCPVPETKFASTADTVACLKEKSMEELVMAQLKLRSWLGYPVVIFAPVIEKESESSFISKEPEKILQEGSHNRVKWISGFTESEGAMFDLLFMQNETLTEDLEENWEERAPYILGYHEELAAKRDQISMKIRNAYVGNFLEIGDLAWAGLRNLLTDRYFAEPVDASVRLQSQHSPVYPYIFRFYGEYSLINKLYGVDGELVACHGDDLQYLFPGGGIGSPDYSGETPAEIIDFSRKFVKLWASFVHENNPNETWEKQKQWKPVLEIKENQHVPYYEIGYETDIWNEDFDSRIKVLKENFPRLGIKPKTSDKTEL